MKPDQQAKIVLSIIVLMCLIELAVFSKTYFNKATELKNDNQNLLSDNISSSKEILIVNTENTITNNENKIKNENAPVIVYDGLTIDQLSEKLNRSLNSTIAGYGNLFASKSLELGLDPYLAVAIVLHETGCSWECSELVNACYNVGGQKGAPGCWGGDYQAFNTMEEGINAFLENLYYNYIAIGLTTPETINSKYAEGTTWYTKINAYIEKIKAT